MKRGLSLIPIVGGGVSLILAGVLVYTRMLGDYGETGALYLLSMMMEEEGLYFAQRYQGRPGYAGQLLLQGQRRHRGLPPKLRGDARHPPPLRASAPCNCSATGTTMTKRRMTTPATMPW